MEEFETYWTGNKKGKRGSKKKEGERETRTERWNKRKEKQKNRKEKKKKWRTYKKKESIRFVLWKIPLKELWREDLRDPWHIDDNQRECQNHQHFLFQRKTQFHALGPLETVSVWYIPPRKQKKPPIRKNHLVECKKTLSPFYFSHSSTTDHILLQVVPSRSFMWPIRIQIF